MDIHPAANVFPMMSKDEYHALVEDMRANGYDSAFPVVTYGGAILDGRNRYAASLEAGVQAKYLEYTGSDPIGYVVRANLHRRHLDSGQRAFCALEVEKLLAEEARKRQGARTDLRQYEQALPTFGKDFPEVEPFHAKEQAAALFGTNAHYITDAKRIQADAPDLAQAVMAGEKSLPEAKRELEQRLDPDSSRAHVSYNSGENEWYTPPEYIAAARFVIGEIDLDPASCDEANKIVKARTYYTKTDDGLMHDWRGNVWMNPPYSSDLIGRFCEKLIKHYDSGDISRAIVLVNNATETAWFQYLLSSASAVCFVKRRIKFIDKKGQATGAPLQGQALLYFGESPAIFESAMRIFGAVLYANQ